MSLGVCIKKSVVIVSAIALLAGCSAMHNAINKKTLDVQTKMSSTIFLDPVVSDKKTVFLQIRNTSDKPEFDLEPNIAAAMIEKGYTVVASPEKAHYLLQVNVLQVGRFDLRELDHALHQGFGGAVSGAIAGAAAGSLWPSGSHNNGRSVVTGGLIGATVGTVTDAMVHDVLYSVITDVQISERVANSIVVREKTRTRLKQGERGVREMTSTEKVEWKRYQTRIISTANKVNLKFKQAAPELIKGLTRSITGIF
jgi:hypothetical protein